jgi:hypothetical protein
VQVQMVRVGAKLVPLANVPFANRDEWHPAYMCVKGWLQGRSRWGPTELADAANALAEWTLDGRRLGGKDIKKQCNGDEERACAWLVGLGVSQAAAARIYRGWVVLYCLMAIQGTHTSPGQFALRAPRRSPSTAVGVRAPCPLRRSLLAFGSNPASRATRTPGTGTHGLVVATSSQLRAARSAV